MSSFSLNTHYSLIAVSGEDKTTFLQGQFTCNMLSIDDTHNRYGGYCNPQGRLIANFRLFFYDTRYLILIPKDMASPLLRALKKFTMFSKVTLTDVSEDFFIQGEQSSEYALKNHMDTQLCDSSILALCVGSTDRYHHILPRTQTATHITSNDSAMLDAKLWENLEIAQGFPWISTKTTLQFTPNELGLLEIDAVNLKKGCYVGQEIIARMAYRGKLKKHLYRCDINHAGVEPGQSLWNAEKRVCGEVVAVSSAIHEADDKTRIMQAVIQDEGVETGEIFCDESLEKPFKIQKIESVMLTN
jgi:tRNA-modifying protein YgfZ